MNSGLKYLGTIEVPEMRMLASTQPQTELVPQFGKGKANRMLSREKELSIVKGLVIAVVMWIR